MQAKGAYGQVVALLESASASTDPALKAFMGKPEMQALLSQARAEQDAIVITPEMLMDERIGQLVC